VNGVPARSIFKVEIAGRELTKVTYDEKA